MNKRLQQINRLLIKEISAALIEEIEFNEGVLATVSQVSVSSDLRHARVFISVYPFGKKMQVLDKIKRRTKDIQNYIFDKVTFRNVPKLSFFIDPTEEKASFIDQSLDQVSNDISDK